MERRTLRRTEVVLFLLFVLLTGYGFYSYRNDPERQFVTTTSWLNDYQSHVAIVESRHSVRVTVVVGADEASLVIAGSDGDSVERAVRAIRDLDPPVGVRPDHSGQR